MTLRLKAALGCGPCAAARLNHSTAAAQSRATPWPRAGYHVEFPLQLLTGAASEAICSTAALQVHMSISFSIYRLAPIIRPLYHLLINIPPLVEPHIRPYRRPECGALPCGGGGQTMPATSLTLPGHLTAMSLPCHCHIGNMLWGATDIVYHVTDPSLILHSCVRGGERWSMSAT
jgi:hypothetical protein